MTKGKQWTAKAVTILHSTENMVAVAAVVLLALIPTMEVFARKFFHTGLGYSTPYTKHLVLFVTFIGGMITSREKKHLSLALSFKIEEPMKSRIHTAIMTISAMMTTAFGWAALSFVLTAFDSSVKIGVFPIRLVGMVMVVGYAIMTVRFITRVETAPTSGGVAPPVDNGEAPPVYKRAWHRKIALTGVLFGTFFAIEPINNILSVLMEEAPGFMEGVVLYCQSLHAVIVVPVIILLVVAAIFGAPLFVVLGGVAYLLFANIAEPLEVIPNQAYSMLISHSIPAIPLFTVAGFILSESKAGERLVRFFKAFFGWFPGGLAIMAILTCTFFTTFTGASGVTILALGALLSYVLVNGKYKRRFSLGLVTASGSIGLLFPPSLPIIIYGIIAGISIKDMFLGGIVPGIVMVVALIVFSVIYASKQKTHREPFKLKEAMAGIRVSIWELLLPVVVVAVYFGGLATLEESAAIAVVYAFIVEFVIHRDLKIKDLHRIILKCIPIIGGVLIILSMANGLNYYIVDMEVPMKLMEWVQANIESKYVFLLLLNIALLVTGCLMDIFSAIMVVVPLIIPLGALFGIHPVHLGVIFLANMELGYLTPPVGLNLFLASYRFNEPLGKLYRDVLPFFFIQLVSVLLITYLPILSTGLLKLVKL